MSSLTKLVNFRDLATSGLLGSILRGSHLGQSFGNNVFKKTRIVIQSTSFDNFKIRSPNSNVFAVRWRSWLSQNQNRLTLQNRSSEKSDHDGLHDVYVNGSASSARARIRRTRQRLRETKHEMSRRIEGMKENVITIPNGLCVLRIGLTPVLSYMVLGSNYEVALGIFAVAGITDFLDGLIARNFPSQKSVCGSFLDPIADKFLVATAFLSLAYVGLIPVPLTALIIGRDSILVGAGFYIRYLSLLPPRTLTKYFDITLATASVSPSFISKTNTGMQLGLIATTLAAPVFHFVDHPYLHALWYVTACSTVASGLGYLFTKNNFTILSRRR